MNFFVSKVYFLYIKFLNIFSQTFEKTTCLQKQKPFIFFCHFSKNKMKLSLLTWSFINFGIYFVVNKKTDNISKLTLKNDEMLHSTAGIIFSLSRRFYWYNCIVMINRYIFNIIWTSCKLNFIYKIVAVIKNI